MSSEKESSNRNEAKRLLFGRRRGNVLDRVEWCRATGGTLICPSETIARRIADQHNGVYERHECHRGKQIEVMYLDGERAIPAPPKPEYTYVVTFPQQTNRG